VVVRASDVKVLFVLSTRQVIPNDARKWPVIKEQTDTSFLGSQRDQHQPYGTILTCSKNDTYS